MDLNSTMNKPQRRGQLQSQRGQDPESEPPAGDADRASVRPVAELKLGTHDWHDQLDRNSAMNGLMSPALTRADYRAILGRLLPCHQAIEAALYSYVGRTSGRVLEGIDEALWRRSAELLGDIGRLDEDSRAPGTASGAGSPPADSPGGAAGLGGATASDCALRLDDEADVWGCLYVVAGSAIGGRVIERAVRSRLGSSVSGSLQFFHGRCANLGSAWQTLCEQIDVALVDAGPRARAVAKAREVFAVFARHLAAPAPAAAG